MKLSLSDWNGPSLLPVLIFFPFFCVLFFFLIDGWCDGAACLHGSLLLNFI